MLEAFIPVIIFAIEVPSQRDFYLPKVYALLFYIRCQHTRFADGLPTWIYWVRLTFTATTNYLVRWAFRSRDCLVIIYGSITVIVIAIWLSESECCLRPAFCPFLPPFRSGCPVMIIKLGTGTELLVSSKFEHYLLAEAQSFIFCFGQTCVVFLIQYKYYTKIWVPCQELFFVCLK